MLRPSLLLIAAAFAAAGCSGARPDAPAPPAADGTPIVATWTADTLSLAEFDDAFAAAEGAMADSTMTPLERRLDFLDRYVDFRLKVLAARQAGYADDSTYVAEVAGYRDQLAGPYFTDRQVLDSIVRDIYDKQAEQIEASHLLLLLSPAASAADSAEVYDRITSIRDSILAGAYTFTEAASQFSEDPSAAQNGGSLGWVTGGQTVLAFEDALYNTAVGEVSQPVRTVFGVHILQVEGRRENRAQIGARHILIRTTEEVSADSARQVIEMLRDRVAAGEDFAALARQYSDDTGSGAQGGDLGTFGRGRMVPPFEEAAFALTTVGELSGPVESRFGVHLIQLTDAGSRPSFEDAEPSLRQTANRLPRTALRRQAVGREYLDGIGATYDEALVREAVYQYGEDAARDSLLTTGFGAYDDRAFATVADSTFRFRDIQPTLQRVRYGPHPAGQMLETVRGVVDEYGAQLALESLEDRDPEFARVFRSYSDGVLLFRVAEDSVWTPAREDTVGLRRAFDQNAGQYRWPERRRVFALRAASDSLLRAAAAAFDAGTPASDLAGQFEGVSFDTVFVADSTDSALDGVLGLSPGERTEVALERGRRAFYVLDGIEAPRAKTFEEARAEVITDFQETVEAEWEARLRARYDARVYPERVTPAPMTSPASVSAPTATSSE